MKDLIIIVCLILIGTCFQIIPGFFPEYPHLELLDDVGVIFILLAAFQFIVMLRR